MRTQAPQSPSHHDFHGRFREITCERRYGATENIVWEGVGAPVTLAAGSYTVTIAGETETGLSDTAPELLACVFTIPNDDFVLEKRRLYANIMNCF